jgi:hypothetical protein
MSQIGPKMVWIAGGAALFAAAFLGVGLVRGVALRDVPPLSWLTGRTASSDVPHGASTATTAAAAAAESATPASRASVIPPMTAGGLAPAMMPSPHSARGLPDLERR